MRCLQLSSNHRTVRENHHSHCRYYIRSALPFGSPVNTNFHLLRMVRCHGSRTDVLPPIDVCIVQPCNLSAVPTDRRFWRNRFEWLVAECLGMVFLTKKMTQAKEAQLGSHTCTRGSPSWHCAMAYISLSCFCRFHGLQPASPQKGRLLRESPRTGPEMAVLDLGFWMITDDDITSRMKGYAMPLCTATWYMHLKNSKSF